MYFPSPAMMRCPYQMRALELWFTLRWLEEGEWRALAQRQRAAHKNPPPETPENAGPVFGTPSHALIGALAPWVRYRGEAGYRIPAVYQTIAQWDELRRHHQAVQSFAAELHRVLTKHNQQLRGLNVFAVWAGFVKHDEDNPIEIDDLPLETALAEYEIFGSLVVDPGSLELIVAVISSAIEINFKDDLAVLRGEKPEGTVSEDAPAGTDPYNELPL